jgi:hypothetical protein
VYALRLTDDLLLELGLDEKVGELSLLLHVVGGRHGRGDWVSLG